MTTNYLYQVWNADNDMNGNPRRVTMVYAPDGSIVAAFDDNYAGDHIPPGAVTLPTVRCKIMEYRDALKVEEWRQVARRYLDHLYPTGIEHIGRKALKSNTFAKLFRNRVIACRGKVRDLEGIRSSIWAIEEHRRNGYAHPATDDGIAIDLRVAALKAGAK